MTDNARWQATLRGLGVEPPAQPSYETLTACYREAHRSYHTLQHLAEAGLPAAVGERVRDLILATRHDGVATTTDAALLVDVDLAILGAPAVRFDEYEAQLRREYRWVPDVLFRGKRRQILEAFAARPTLFTTARFRAAFEGAARANLARSIAALGGATGDQGLLGGASP